MELEKLVKETKEEFKPKGVVLQKNYGTNATYKGENSTYGTFLHCGCTPSCGTPARCGILSK